MVDGQSPAHDSLSRCGILERAGRCARRAGLGLLLTNLANGWIRGGAALLLCASSFRRVTVTRFLRTNLMPAYALQVWSAAHVTAGLMCGIGSIVMGGAIGWLGVFLSLRIATTGSWMFRQFSQEGDVARVINK